MSILNGRLQALLFWLVRRKGAMNQGSEKKHLWGISESEILKKKKSSSTVPGRKAETERLNSRTTVSCFASHPDASGSAHVPLMGMAVLCRVHRPKLSEGPVPDQCLPQVLWDMHTPAFAMEHQALHAPPQGLCFRSCRHFVSGAGRHSSLAIASCPKGSKL